MKKRHSPKQIIRKFRESEWMLSAGKMTTEVCRQLEVRERTLNSSRRSSLARGHIRDRGCRAVRATTT